MDDGGEGEARVAGERAEVEQALSSFMGGAQRRRTRWRSGGTAPSVPSCSCSSRPSVTGCVSVEAAFDSDIERIWSRVEEQEGRTFRMAVYLGGFSALVALATSLLLVIWFRR